MPMRLGQRKVNLLSIALIPFLLAAKPPVLDEEGKEVPEPLVKCMDWAYFEPDWCNAFGLSGLCMGSSLQVS